jgi:hypothetical protein
VVLHRAVDLVDQRIGAPSGSRLASIATLNLVVQVLETLSRDVTFVTAFAAVLPTHDLRRESEELEVITSECGAPRLTDEVLPRADQHEVVSDSAGEPMLRFCDDFTLEGVILKAEGTFPAGTRDGPAGNILQFFGH